MTTLSFDSAHASFFAARQPRHSFAARLAALQARHEQAPHFAAVVGVAARLIVAAVPAGALAWLFVFA